MPDPTGDPIRIVEEPALKILDFPHGCSIFLLPERAQWIKTSMTGKWIYELLRERPRPLGELVRDVAESYGLPEDRVGGSVQALVRELRHNGLAAAGDEPRQVPRPVSMDELILQQLWLNLTTACNLHCAYCFVPGTGTSARHMDLRLARKILDQAAPMGVLHLVLSGGEPTLHPDLAAIVAHAAAKKQFQIKLITNGARTDPEFYAPLVPAVSDIQVSVDGIDAATHDALRGSGSFARIVELFRMLRQHYPTLTRGISFTPVPENVEQMPYLFKLALTLGASYIHVNRPKLPARPEARSRYGEETFLGMEFFRRALAQFDTLLANILKDRELNQGFDGRTLPGLDTSFDPGSELFGRIKKPRCAAGVLTMCVDPDGHCYPCAALCRPEHRMGNASRKRLASVYASMRRRVDRGFSVDCDPVCSQCDFRYFCAGGCRANNPDLSAHDPVCELLRERYTSVLANVPNPRKFQRSATADEGAAVQPEILESVRPTCG
jgi:radical SAM protein with 4Fe4S-binding SPASM domain